jgi:4-amino-4-deoxy-L-arabinose transferase-like glycosyltransferase
LAAAAFFGMLRSCMRPSSTARPQTGSGRPAAISARRRVLTALAVAAALALGVWLRTAALPGFTYAGSDSYAYLGAAAELAENHRFANRPPPWYPRLGDPTVPTPLSYGRLPGYPLLLATLIKPPVREYKDYLPVFARLRPVQTALDLLTCVVVFFLAGWLGGPLAAWPALLLAVTSPYLVLFCASVLTETLATCCSTIALGCLIAALYQRQRARLWWPLAGGVMALGMLVRIDGILLLPCLLVPALWPSAVGAASRRAGVRLTAVSLLVLLVVFSPWPLRNQLRFGDPHPFGRPCDVRGREMPHTAFFSWFATWLRQESDTPSTLFCFFHDDCRSSVQKYPPHAFDSAAERQAVEELFQLRAREGLSERVDAGFRALAQQRLRHHPFRSLIQLPLVRAYYQWTGPADQPLRSAPHPVPFFSARSYLFPRLSQYTALLGLVGLLLLWARARTRAAALVLTLAVLGRTAFMALIGFVENRYQLELLPAALALCGVALASPFSALLGWLRGRRHPTPTR